MCNQFSNFHPSDMSSYDWTQEKLNDLLTLLLACRVGGRSNVNDFTLAAEASLPIIYAMLADIKKKTYPQNCFLNVDFPTDVVNHKVSFGFVLELGKSLPISVVTNYNKVFTST